MAEQKNVAPAQGKLGILMPGMGAVATTCIAGVEAVRRGLGTPVGSLTQMGRMPVRPGQKIGPVMRDVLPLASLDAIAFGGWDVYEGNAYEAARTAGVLDKEMLAELKPALEKIKPMSAAFDPAYVKNLDGKHIKEGTRWDWACELKEDIARFAKENGCDRMVMVWCGSTEVYCEPQDSHKTVRDFEAALKRDDASIAPSMVYAYAALSMGVPFANGAPNLTTDVPALDELAMEMGVPTVGKDFKTGQTMMKTLLAPAFKARCLGLNGWFSTNILGNRDGAVLDDPASFRTKEVSKLSVLETILDSEQYPELYSDYSHAVRINYYPPRGDNKEGWDNIDIFGWLGYPMQIKVDFLCRDSILAAPLVLDLALLLDIAKRANMRGVQEWMSFYFKSPTTKASQAPEHDLFAQLNMLHAALEPMRTDA